MASPADEAIAEAGRDPEVVDAAKALILDVLGEARRTLHGGDPPSKQAVMRMFATPIVKEVLSPTRESTDDDHEELVERFHQIRRAANDQ